MIWKNIPHAITNRQFQRLTGVKRSTFDKMCFIIKEVKTQRRKHPKRGKEAKLCIEDQLLMMLMYYREYRTFMHIGTDYGMSESQCWRIVTDLENILIQSNAFRLPGKKVLTKSNVKWSVVLVDVGESPIERPKKTAAVLLREKEKAHS
jgi:predicted DNA-binding transcriptional regulator AlpA